MHDHPYMLAELYEKFQFTFLHSLLPTKSIFGGQSFLNGFPNCQDRALRTKTGMAEKKSKGFLPLGDGNEP